MHSIRSDESASGVRWNSVHDGLAGGGGSAQLSRLVEVAAYTRERFEITRNGQRVAVLRGADDYDTLLETRDLLSESDLWRDHLAGIDELSHGRGLDAAQPASAMREAGRPLQKKE
jgi:prevent-host-death family protein